MQSNTKFGWGGEGGLLVIPMPGRRVPERRSGLHPFEEELMERHSGTFYHKNTPVCKYTSSYISFFMLIRSSENDGS
jgi:hypothetical protein